MANPPSVDTQRIVDQGEQLYELANSILAGKIGKGPANYIAGGLQVVFTWIAPLAIGVLSMVVELGEWFGEVILDAIDRAKESNRDQMNELIAATVNEMLGTDFSGGEFATSGNSNNTFDQSKAVGENLLRVFEDGFGLDTGVTPEAGKDNAKKFLGFGVNFAISQGFLSILTEASSLGFLKEFHELPDGLMQAMGLGRLQRQALAPLVRNCIAQPYDLYLKRLLRPDRLSEAQVVQALRAGKISEDVARDQLAQKGYRDEDIDILLDQLTARLSPGELALLIANGDVEEPDALDRLKAGGMDEDTAKLLLKATDLSRASAQVSGILSILESARLNGFIDQETFDKEVSNLPLGDLQDQLFRNRVGLQLEMPRKRLSFAQLKAGLVNGHTDLEYLDTWFAAEGYDDESQIVLTLEIIDAMKSASDRNAAKQKLASKTAAKGKTPPATATTPEPTPNPTQTP